MKLLNPNPPMISTFTVANDIPSIACIGGGLAWVQTGCQALQLIDKTCNTVIDTIYAQSDIRDFAITKDCRILLTEHGNKCVEVVSMKEFQRKILTLFNTELQPGGLCCLHDGTILVTFHRNSKIIQYSAKGEVLNELDHIELRCPCRVAQNKLNHDIYITDKEGIYPKAAGKIIALDSNFNFKYFYTGLAAEDELFTPVEICSDEAGHILIADMANDVVHVLDCEGQFIQYILTREQRVYEPVTIDVDREGMVWVGTSVEAFEEGTVHVARYLQDV